MASLQDGSGPITQFPASDLRSSQRFITSHNAAGDGIFVATDSGDHHRVMVNGKGAANIIYSTQGNPVDVTGEIDIALAAKKEPGLHIHNGSVARMIDFAPGVESPMHRAMSVDYGVVIEGEFELTLSSGESRIMKPGDVSVNRATMHKWRNCDDERSGRMLFILLDCKPFEVNGKMAQQDLGDLAGEYADN
ncbi:MAG: hypothetical protein Q9161_000753 [Pseudevernia consocians]